VFTYPFGEIWILRDSSRPSFESVEYRCAKLFFLLIFRMASLSRPGDQSVPDFLVEFQVSGPRIPSRNQSGEEIWSLWKIWNKCTIALNDRELYYQAQYWENRHGKNLVHVRPIAEVKTQYPAEASRWEARFGREWDAQYGMRGNVCPSSPCEPPSGKRGFLDTPQKDRQQEKKIKVSVTEVGSDSDDDIEMDSPVHANPVLTSHARASSQPDPFADGSKTAVLASMPPPPVPPRNRLLAGHPSRRFFVPGQSVGGSSSRMNLDSPNSSSQRPAPGSPQMRAADDSDSAEGSRPRSRPSGRPRAILSTAISPPRRPLAANSSRRLIARGSGSQVASPHGSPLRRRVSRVVDVDSDNEDSESQTESRGEQRSATAPKTGICR
jgi:hypothetical protein